MINKLNRNFIVESRFFLWKLKGKAELKNVSICLAVEGNSYMESGKRNTRHMAWAERTEPRPKHPLLTPGG